MIQERSWSIGLGRVIKTGTAGKTRLLLEKGIVIAIRELAQQAQPDEKTYDLLAYIALSLNAIGATIDESVAAWEKRGYWLKADHYRMEWDWASKSGEELKQALRREDWVKVTQIIAQVTQKLGQVKVAQNNRLGRPWLGAWDKLISPD